MISYPIGALGQVLLFDAEVVERFKRHQQHRWWQREAGGQLFARFNYDTIHVLEATGPRRSDRRGRYSYEPDRRAEQQEIDDRFPLGLHFVGDWHTHPEDYPSPSSIDLKSTSEGVRRSGHELSAFVLVIVGRAPLPSGLFVALHDGCTQHVLDPIPMPSAG